VLCWIVCLQDRWLDNRDCAYAVGSGAELSEGERRLKRFAPFSDGIKNCLGQVRERARLRASWTASRCSQCWQYWQYAGLKPHLCKQQAPAAGAQRLCMNF
jgi:hypothetical protein